MLINSPVKAIDDLRISTMKLGRPVDGKMVCISRGNAVIVAVSKKGTIFCNHDASSYCLESFWWVKSVLSALVTLKVIDKSDMDAHLKACAEKRLRQEYDRDKRDVMDICRKRKWSVRFPGSQK